MSPVFGSSVLKIHMEGSEEGHLVKLLELNLDTLQDL